MSSKRPTGRRMAAYLVYNSRGHIFTYELATGETKEIDTGFAMDCNNDHVLSPDNTQVAVSHFTNEDATSRIYIVPLQAGARTGNRKRSQLFAWLVAGRQAPGILCRAQRPVRYLLHLRQRRSRNPAHGFGGTGRWAGICSRWQPYLVQLHSNRVDASLAHGNGWRQPDSHGTRRCPLLVPARFTKWQLGRLHRLW